MNSDGSGFGSEIIELMNELACREAHAQATTVERVVWTERVYKRKRFALIALEQGMNLAHVRRIWFQFLTRISDDVRLAAMADERLREAFGRSLSDPDAFSSILGGMLAYDYPPRLR